MDPVIINNVIQNKSLFSFLARIVLTDDRYKRMAVTSHIYRGRIRAEKNVKSPDGERRWQAVITTIRSVEVLPLC